MLERNPNYWREGEPYLDSVVFEYIPDSNTRTLQLRSGQADVADGIPYNQVESLDASEGITVEVADSLKWDAIWLNNTEPPLDEPEVRQALNYATRRERSWNRAVRQRNRRQQPHPAGQVLGRVDRAAPL